VIKHDDVLQSSKNRRCIGGSSQEDKLISGWNGCADDGVRVERLVTGFAGQIELEAAGYFDE